jgi:dTDP-4-amino-4,6-dideoxygalactose transaminase
MELALRIAGIGPGDEVITTPMSWVATANVTITVGATPVFVDADRATRNIDLDKLEAAITPRTKAIIPVDLAGLAVDRDRLYDIAKRHKLRVIEDAAQSIGASWKGRRVGSSGDMVSFSFHANKNMTTAEGGCLVMNNEEEARLFEKLRLQGVTRFPGGEMDMDVLGYKFNLTDVAAAIGLGQIKRLEAFNARRGLLAKLYFKQIDRSLGLELPQEDHENTNWHMFQPLLPIEKLRGGRKAFIEAMHERGIGVGVHYPAMHLFSYYRERGFKAGDFPVSEYIGARTITLPLFPAMRDDDVTRVCDTMRDVIHSLAA